MKYFYLLLILLNILLAFGTTSGLASLLNNGAAICWTYCFMLEINGDH